jgi:sulfonate transport system substrate-binding protein
MTSFVPKLSRILAVTTRAAAAAAVLTVCVSAAHAEGQVLPRDVPKGTKLVVGDQNERLQTLIIASGEQAKLAADVTYANFIGGPAILEAFRAGALDLATVGSTPPIQAQAAGEEIPIVAAQRTSEPDYKLAVRPGLKINTLEELRGKKIAYAEGTGRQPFILNALKQAGLTTKDVTLVRLRASDFPDAIRGGQVDVASLNEPHFSRYLTKFEGSSVLPDSQHDRLPRNTQYLYASAAALKDPAKTAAIRDFIIHWIAANRWSEKDPAAWIDAYYVKKQNLKAEDGKAITDAEGITAFPLLKDLIAPQQATIDLIYEAGDIPKRLDAKAEFDLRFDEVLANAPTN